jgi:hypothetical protein
MASKLTNQRHEVNRKRVLTPFPDGVGGSEDFYVLSGGRRMFSTFGAITSVAMVDRAEV